MRIAPRAGKALRVAPDQRHSDARPEVRFSLSSWASVPLAATRTRDEALALALARQLAAQAAADPTRFAELTRQHSEDLPRRDEGGAMGGVQATQIALWPQVLDALAAIAPGQTELSAPEHPDVEHFLAGLDPPESQSFLRAIAKHTSLQLALTGAIAERFSALHELKVDDRLLLEGRLEAFRAVLDGSRQLLEPQADERYRAELYRVIRAGLLGAPGSIEERGL